MRPRGSTSSHSPPTARPRRSAFPATGAAPEVCKAWDLQSCSQRTGPISGPCSVPFSSVSIYCILTEKNGQSTRLFHLGILGSHETQRGGLGRVAAKGLLQR